MEAFWFIAYRQHFVHAADQPRDPLVPDTTGREALNWSGLFGFYLRCGSSH